MKRISIGVLITVVFLICGGQGFSAESGSPAARGNAVSADKLPESLSGLNVKDYFIASGTAPVGKIMMLSGGVVVHHKDTGKAYFAARGDAVFGGDVFYSLKGSRCRVKFVTADLVTIGEDTVISIDELVDDRGARKKKSVFSMVKGKAMFYVVRLFRYKTVDATVKTQTAVMGVRGTQFGVEVVPGAGKLAQGQRITIADASENGFQMLAESMAAGGQGGFTKVIVFAGKVFVVSGDSVVELPAGQEGIFWEDGSIEENAIVVDSLTEFLMVMGMTPEEIKDFLDGIDTRDEDFMQQVLDKLNEDKMDSGDTSGGGM